MSRFTAKKRSIPWCHFMPSLSLSQTSTLARLLLSHISAMPKPVHWAIIVPKATPSIRSPNPKTKVMETSRLVMFCAMETYMGMRVFCMPMNHPVRL